MFNMRRTIWMIQLQILIPIGYHIYFSLSLYSQSVTRISSMKWMPLLCGTSKLTFLERPFSVGFKGKKMFKKIILL